MCDSNMKLGISKRNEMGETWKKKKKKKKRKANKQTNRKSKLEVRRCLVV